VITLWELMGRAAGWFNCRVGYLEAGRAIGLAGSRSAVRALHSERPAFGVIEIDQDPVEKALDSLSRTSCEVGTRYILERRSCFLVMT